MIDSTHILKELRKSFKKAKTRKLELKKKSIKFHLQFSDEIEIQNQGFQSILFLYLILLKKVCSI